MKIEKAIHSSNDEPFYLDFWPLVSKVWKLKFGITPILLYFGESKIDEQYGEVIKMKTIENVPINTCCQLSRYWHPVTEENTTFITSDIDMFPISKWYFIDQIKEIVDDKFVNLNYIKKNSHYPCCYNVAKGKVFKEVLKLKETWEEFIAENCWKQISNNHKPNGLNKSLKHWSADEIWSSKMINNFDQNRIVKIFREGESNYRRIDRSKWSWHKSYIHEFYDCHSLRPYSSYKYEIDNLVEAIIESTY